MRPHEDSWLVARADALIERHIAAGELGCPICFARYAVRDGVVDFSDGASHVRDQASPSAEMPVRAAALLGLTEPGGVVVLTGEWSGAANEILDMTENVQILALDYSRGLRSGGALSLALIADVLPLAAASARGIALDAAHATPSLLAGAARALAPEGRLIAPAHAPVPASLRELARDGQHWVAASSATNAVSAPVSIAIKR